MRKPQQDTHNASSPNVSGHMSAQFCIVLCTNKKGEKKTTKKYVSYQGDLAPHQGALFVSREQRAETWFLSYFTLLARRFCAVHNVQNLT